MQITLWGDIASYFIPAPAGPVNHLGYLYLRIYRICTVLITMWGDVASCTCWTTLCICIWVFVFFLYFCICVLVFCICAFSFAHLYFRIAQITLWGDAARPPCPMQQWIMITLCDAPAHSLHTPSPSHRVSFILCNIISYILDHHHSYSHKKNIWRPKFQFHIWAA